MRIKLDENLGTRGCTLFRDAGYDVVTVRDQGLCAGADADLLDVCRAEGRCLVTLDLDFGNPLLFRPARYSGIAVLRLPRYASLSDLLNSVRTLIGGLGQDSIEGHLWVVQRGKIRVYQPSIEENERE